MGEFFMWAASHDVWGPTYLSRCLAVLASNATIVHPGLGFGGSEAAVQWTIKALKGGVFGCQSSLESAIMNTRMKRRKLDYHRWPRRKAAMGLRVK